MFSGKNIMYRDEIYSLQILLSRTQAEPGRAVKKEQEEISPNHVRRINLISVQFFDYDLYRDGLKNPKTLQTSYVQR